RERVQVELNGVAELQHDVVAGVPQVRLERGVELHRVHPGNALREVAREYAEAGADLEDDVVGLELGQAADHAEDVLVDEEVLAEALLRRDVHPGKAKHSVAVRSICRSSSARFSRGSCAT